MIEVIGGSSHEAPREAGLHIQRPRSGYEAISRDSQEPYRSPIHFHTTRSPVPAYTPYDPVIQPTIVSPPSRGVSDPKSPVSIAVTPDIRSPSIHYSEVHSPDPEVVHLESEKEAYTFDQKHLSSETCIEPVPGIRHTSSVDHPQVFHPYKDDLRGTRRRPWYKRRICVCLLLLVLLLVALAIALGVVFGLRRQAAEHAGLGSNLDPEINTGGYLNSQYYSRNGAFNGSGVAIAAAKPGIDTSIYAFYQSYTGEIMYTLMNPQNQWDLVGPVNSGSYQAMNATPLSTVQHQVGNQSVWHLFYIDVNYYIRERVITNDTTNSPSPIWQDGTLNSLNLKAYKANTIGMQACYWGDYYGRYSLNGQARTTGIHLWYADSATTFQQYSWSNGTNRWDYEKTWTDLDGHAGVACQTWDSGTSTHTQHLTMRFSLTLIQPSMCGLWITSSVSPCTGKTATKPLWRRLHIPSENGRRVGEVDSVHVDCH